MRSYQYAARLYPQNMYVSVSSSHPLYRSRLHTLDSHTAFYDIDTPVTLAKLRRHDCEYIAPHLIPQYDLYLSFAGGPIPRAVVERRYRSPRACPLYCAFDPDLYYPDNQPVHWDMGYMGTYSADWQPALYELLLESARHSPRLRFVVAGTQFPPSVTWPENVERTEHLPPAQHRSFYTAQRFTLNLSRADVKQVGYLPSVRLFEAAACGSPIISDYWPGLESLFEIGKEILVVQSCRGVVRVLRTLPEDGRRNMGERARQRVLAEHTAAYRAQELEQYFLTALENSAWSAVIGCFDCPQPRLICAEPNLIEVIKFWCGTNNESQWDVETDPDWREFPP